MERLTYYDYKNKFEQEFSNLTQVKKFSRIKVYLSLNRFFLKIYNENIFWAIINSFMLVIIFIISHFIPVLFNVLMPCLLLGSFLTYHFYFIHNFKIETAGEIDAIETEILVLEDMKKEIEMMK